MGIIKYTITSGTRRGGQKNRKYGRNRRKPAKVRYTNEMRWITNKIKKIKKYMKKHPNWKPTKTSKYSVSSL